MIAVPETTEDVSQVSIKSLIIGPDWCCFIFTQKLRLINFHKYYFVCYIDKSLQERNPKLTKNALIEMSTSTVIL